MSRIDVTPGNLRSTGASAVSLGGRVSGLAGHVSSTSGGGAPSSTAAALERFSTKWSGHVADLGESIRGIGVSADAAASLYERADGKSFAP
jgi:hypothetical protein